jgi:hypothetical protein
MTLYAEQNGFSKIAAIDWYFNIFYFRYNGQNGYVDENSPSLAICYESGKLQFQCTFNDPSTVE